MGKARTPTALKLLKGTARKCRLNKDEPKPEVGMPEPPDHLSKRAAKVYREFAKVLLGMRVLTVADGAGLEALAQAYVDHREATEFLDKMGSTVYSVTRSSPDGVTHEEFKPYPQVAQRNDADKRLRGWLQSFGLTPSDRSRVSAVVGDKSASPWAGLLKDP